MPVGLAVALAMAAALSLPAEDPAKLSEGLPRELAMIVDGALAVPPELGAEALIRAATSGGIRSPEKRIALLERAAEIGAYVEKPHPRVFVGPRFPASKEYFQGLKYGLKLDRLSITARSLTEIGRIDRRRSLEEVPHFAPYRLERRSCEDALVDDVAAYYDLCAVTVNHAFNEERRRGEHLDLAMSALSRVTFAAEVAPAARMVASLDLPPDETGQLANSLAGALERVHDSGRGFSAAQPRIDRALRQALIPRLVKLGIDPAALETAYQNYRERHLKAPPCAENQMRLTPFLREDPEIMRLASRLVFRDAAAKVRYTPEERTGEEWRARFEEFTTAVGRLQPGPDQSPADLFRIQRMLLGEVSALVPPGPERETLLRTYVATLASAPLDGGVAAWLVDIMSLLKLVEAAGAGDRVRVLAMMEQGANANLAFFARMERLLPARKGR